MSSNRKSKHILILGGMGPQASAYAHSLILKIAADNGAVNNEDYPRITHLSVNVKDFISKPTYKNAALKYLGQCLSEIDTSTVNEAFIACNTAHLLKAELEKIGNLRFTSLIDTTAELVAADKKLVKVGILATPSTIKSGLYSSKLGSMIELVQPTLQSSVATETIIRDVISCDSSRSEEELLAKRLKNEIDALLKKGAQKVILGCTELSLLGSHLDGSIIDPLSLTVKKVMRYEHY